MTQEHYIANDDMNIDSDVDDRNLRGEIVIDSLDTDANGIWGERVENDMTRKRSVMIYINIFINIYIQIKIYILVYRYVYV